MGVKSTLPFSKLIIGNSQVFFQDARTCISTVIRKYVTGVDTMSPPSVLIGLTIINENLILSCLDPHWLAGPCTSNHIEDYDGTLSYDNFPSYDDFPLIKQILI